MTISQVSAAMSLKCGTICNDRFVANFVLSLAVKQLFWKSINISRSYRHKYRVLFFDSHYIHRVRKKGANFLFACNSAKC